MLSSSFFQWITIIFLVNLLHHSVLINAKFFYSDSDNNATVHGLFYKGSMVDTPQFTQNFTICAFVAKTNIGQLDSKYSCTESNVPDSDICRGLWFQSGIVKCDDDLLMTSFTLFNTSVTGVLTPAFHKLSDTLITLIITNTSISSTIPSLYSRLTNLQTLSLANNKLNGEIPPLLGALSSITSINLSNNKLTATLPSELSSCENLVQLDVSGNALSESIPSALSNLHLLTYLNFENNKLTGNIMALTDVFQEQQYDYISPVNTEEEQELKHAVFRLNDQVDSRHQQQSSSYYWSSLQYLNLGNNRFTGTLKTSIGYLYTLTSLVLSSNKITGTFPSSLAALTNLVTFDFQNTDMTGNIPEVIGSLSSLEILNLNNNRFYGPLPSTIASLSTIKELHLSGNLFSTTLPTILVALHSLTYLESNSNGYYGPIPSSYGTFRRLQTLDLYNNSLSGPIPSALGTSAALNTVILVENELTGTLPTFPTTANFTTLNLSYNNIYGTIPSSIGNILPLQYLSLDYNIFSGGLPSELGYLSNLMDLSIIFNSLSRSLPTSLGLLSALTSLVLTYNNMISTLPSTIGNLAQLVTLKLDYNIIYGTIPTTIANLYQLEYLHLQNNDLTGTIFAHLGLLTNLKSIKFQNNYLSGSIPYSIGSLFQLEQLHLYNNGLTGPLPYVMGQLTSLLSLQINTCSLTGSIPSTIGSLRSLTSLIFYDNKLTGTLPPSLNKATSLNVIILSYNILTGTLPDLSALSTLRLLYLDANHLSGSLPTSLYHLTRLNSLSINYNKLTGVISEDLSKLVLLQTLDLHENKLSGSIPSSIFYSIFFLSINLADNKLTGTIPDVIYLQILLKDISYSNNQLSGTITSLFGNMLSLNYLSLESNRLTGTIPATMVGNALTHLSLSDNCLAGSVPSLICEQSLNQLLIDRNIGLGCYASCLEGITSLKSGVITTCDHASLMCDLVASTSATGKLAGWQCVDNIPATSVCSGDWKGVTCSSSTTTEVTSISISDSCLVGSLPSSFGHLLSLTSFDISGNSMSAALPSTLGNLSNLVTLGLHTNLFTGTLPSGLGKIGTLKTMQLQNNNFQGTIPSAIAGASLTALLLANNQLLGSVPSELCSRSLKKISFSSNPSLGCYASCVSGSISSVDYGTLTSCTQASTLCDIITATNIQAKLPTWNCSRGVPSSDVCGGSWNRVTCANQSISSLALNGLSLTGYLPASIDQLSQLLFLNTSYNYLKGSIPDSLKSLTKLVYLDLSHNSISSTIPAALSTLSKIAYLSFSSNRLTKSIPKLLWALSMLSHFDLHSNSLSGSIPSSLVLYSSLTFLDVSGNRLTGTLPVALCSLKYLSVNGNGNLGCYPTCSSKIGTFVRGSVTACTSSSSSDSPVLSTAYITIIVVLGSALLCFLVSMVVYWREMKRRKERDAMITDSTLASRSISSVVVIGAVDGQSLNTNYNNHILFHGTLTLKSLDERSPVNILVSPAAALSEREYELQFALHQMTPKVFARPFGYARHELIDFSAIDSAKLLNAPRNPAGIVLEPCTGGLSDYLNEELVEAEIRYYRKGKVATSLINIVATAAAKNMMLSELNLSHLRVYENDCIKLAVIGMTTAFGEKIDKETRHKSMRKSSQASQKSAGESTRVAEGGTDSHLDLATVPLVAWKLGILLLELFSGSSSLSSTPSDSSFDMINFMDQEGIELMIGRLCPGPRNHLRRQLLCALLRVNPEQRPLLTKRDFQADQFLEEDEENVLFFFIRRGVSLSIVTDLLNENPEYVCLMNSEGHLPLQYALTVDADPLLLAHLLTIYPESFLSRFPENDFSLTDYALQHSMSDAHMRVLLPYFMPIDSDGRERASEAHDYGWAKVLQHLDPPDKYIDTVLLMLTKYNDHIRQLAYCVDELGRTALNIATPKCKEEIIKILYFLGVYDLASEIAHQSKTCVVRLGVDTQQHCKVALKFMKHKDQFEREISVRAKANFSEEFVLGFLRSMDSDTDECLREELAKKGFTGFRYVLVMPEAERTLLEIIAHEHIAGNDWDKIRGLCTQLAQAVRHVHSAGLIHGDIKPLNIMRVRGRLVLIDLDACVSYKEGQYAGAKYSSAYVPPEMVYLHDKGDASGSGSGSGATAMVRSYAVDVSLQPIAEGLPYTLLPAQPSYDMWALGVTLFHLCSGTPLFRCDNDDSIGSKALKELHRWSDSYLTELLSIVSDPLARNLLSQLLNKNPERRPSADRVLAHPFLSGKVAARLPGELPEFDVFISYRVASDAHHVERLHRALSVKEVKVWWDRVCLEDGKPWEEGFCNGLAKSMAFVPILSREAINSDLQPNRQNFSHLTADSPCDNVFLEHRLALEMRAMGLIELIYPVMIGDHAEGTYSHYFGSGCHPKANPITVKAVEEKVVEHLDRQGLGAPLGTTTTVSGVLGDLLKNQGGFVVGKEDTAFNQIIDKIVDMVAQAHSAKKKSTEEAPVECYSAYQSEIEALKQKVEELTEELNSVYNRR